MAESPDYVTNIRLPRPLVARLHAYAKSKSTAEVTVTLADAIRSMLDRGLNDATRVRAPSRKKAAT